MYIHTYYMYVHTYMHTYYMYTHTHKGPVGRVPKDDVRGWFCRGATTVATREPPLPYLVNGQRYTFSRVHVSLHVCPFISHICFLTYVSLGSLLWDLSELNLETGTLNSLEKNPMSTTAGRAHLLCTLVIHVMR